MTAETATRATCERLVWSRGEDRRCGQSVGVHRWTDYTNREHVACALHLPGMVRRWPESLPESRPNHGTLSLSTPWARGLFGPLDRITVENELPEGWELGVSVSSHRSWVILWLIDPDGTERARLTNHPVRAAVPGAVALAKRAQHEPDPIDEYKREQDRAS